MSSHCIKHVIGYFHPSSIHHALYINGHSHCEKRLLAKYFSSGINEALILGLVR